MGVLMDLIAGDAREILLAISVDDWAGLRDRSRFVAYISRDDRQRVARTVHPGHAFAEEPAR